MRLLGSSPVRYVRLGLLLLLLLPAGMAAQRAAAAQATVVGNSMPESCTDAAFADALRDTPAGGTILFTCGPEMHTIPVTEKVLTKDVTIIGGGGIVLSGNNTNRVLRVEPGVTVTLISLTISGGSTGGNGGGIENFGTLTIQVSTIAGNATTSRGGGIFNAGTLLIQVSTIGANSATNGGGGVFNDGTLTIQSSTINGHASSGEFGSRGGGIYNSTMGRLSIQDSTISENTANFGGGIFNEGMLSIPGSTITGNAANFGGGIYNQGGEVDLYAGSVSGNTAVTGGGGVFNAAGGTVRLHFTPILNNVPNNCDPSSLC